MDLDQNPAVAMLRAAAGTVVDTYGCPCRAKGRLVEVSPGIFLLEYAHDDWCPVLRDG